MAQPERHRTGIAVAGAVGLAGTAVGLASEVRLKRRERPLSDDWLTVPITPGRSTTIGVSFRPRQAESFELDPVEALRSLLNYPFDLIRLAAYWSHLEAEPGRFDASELDWQVDAAEAAGKRIIVCVGAVKAFGYPEYFVPEHVLDARLPEHRIVSSSTHPSLLAASTDFARRIVERYRHREAVVAWQVEHEAVDPLGMEHSWRLADSFVRSEVDAVRSADPSRPVVLNGFLPTSTPVRLAQWWRTRDQGDSLKVAGQLADVIGVDFYPRHALFSLGRHSAYLDGAGRTWQQHRWHELAAWVRGDPRRQVIVTEGQAEPWEAVTVPPNPDNAAVYSCLPEDVIGNFNRAMRYSKQAGVTCAAYLFWGAEYWLLRKAGGDPRYLDAFARVLAEHTGDGARPARIRC
jgi:Beta-galactosidase